jgi:hypothetical protein
MLHAACRPLQRQVGDLKHGLTGRPRNNIAHLLAILQSGPFACWIAGWDEASTNRCRAIDM